MNNKLKKQVLTVLLAIMGFVAAQAQQISVVSTNGTTHLFSTLQEAIEGASSGSVIYLPGGVFPISSDVKITKKLTIMGIGHKIDGDNIDGTTTINGHLYFNQGSDGSAVIGCRVPNGQIIIGEDGVVNNVLIKLCFLQSIDCSPGCMGTVINQNYITDDVFPNDSEATITNNIIRANGGGYYCVSDLRAGYICNNIFIYGNTCLYKIKGIVEGNIFIGTTYFDGGGSTMQTLGNMAMDASFGDNPISITNPGNGWEDVFVKYNGGAVSTFSDFHFKQEYKQYESQVGIYAGTGFSETLLPPTPYIVGKIIPENTDAAGKLNIRVRVKASASE